MLMWKLAAHAKVIEGRLHPESKKKVLVCIVYQEETLIASMEFDDDHRSIPLKLWLFPF